jgi:DMSO/TMAO reductase YedYZ molybdopterin-dependent catalytic subunit
MISMDRRSFLLAGGVLGLGPALGRAWPATADDLIPRQKNPDNLEFRFDTLGSFITPNDHFYVRNHFPMPTIAPAAWKLHVEGAVAQPIQLTYEEIRRMPARTVVATLECAGNNRAFLEPRAKGVQWLLGAVGNARWTGVPLAAVLDRAGLRDPAVEVILEGADQGEPGGDSRPVGKIHFARSLPLSRVRTGDVLLAYGMNGHELPPAHGFPLRAVVPGWYGVASIKWLERLVVTTRPFNGFFQSFDYSTFGKRRGIAETIPISEMQVKAEIARPRADEVVKTNSNYRIHGAAWTGDADIARVDVSTDGGRTWSPAPLLGKNVPHAWRLWEYAWHAPATPGTVKVMARATDSRGRQQPLTRDPNRRNYLISHVLPVEVKLA